MQVKTYRKILLTLLCCPFISFAQQNTTSSYSAYGIGDFQTQGFALNNDLGGLGVALRPTNSLNPLNPASLSALKVTAFEAGAKGVSLWQKGQEKNEDFLSLSLSHLSLGFPVREGLAISGGLLPYSFQGYELSVDSFEGGDSLTYNHLGSGGINRAYINVGLEVVQGLSIGLTGSVLFGQLNQDSDVRSYESQVLERSISNTNSLRGQTWDLGLQYQTDFKDMKATFGAVLNPETSFDLINNKSIQTYEPSDSEANDTTRFEKSETDMRIPKSFTFGLALEKETNWLISAEYDFKETSKMPTLGELSYQMRDASQIKVGAWWTPNAQDIHNYINTIQYRAGFNYQSGHLMVPSNLSEGSVTEISEVSLSLGMGLPMKKSKATANIGVELGKCGTQDGLLMEESFVKFHLAFTFNDNWFAQRKIN